MIIVVILDNSKQKKNMCSIYKIVYVAGLNLSYLNGVVLCNSIISPCTTMAYCCVGVNTRVKYGYL